MNAASAARPDPGPDLQLQREEPPRDRRPEPAQLLLRAARRTDPQPAGDRVPSGLAPPGPRKNPASLGWRPDPSQQAPYRLPATQSEWLHFERLPACAPELNPLAYPWSSWKPHELAKFCPTDIWELGHAAGQALARIRRRKRRPELIAALLPPTPHWFKSNVTSSGNLQSKRDRSRHHCASPAQARLRWLRRFFASSGSSANVCRASLGTKSGS